MLISPDKEPTRRSEEKEEDKDEYVDRTSRKGKDMNEMAALLPPCGFSYSSSAIFAVSWQSYGSGTAINTAAEFRIYPATPRVGSLPDATGGHRFWLAYNRAVFSHLISR